MGRETLTAVSSDPLDNLKRLATLPDEDIAPAQAALDLAAAGHSGLSVERHTNHLKKLCREVEDHHTTLIKAGADDDVYTQLAALKHVISTTHDYTKDTQSPDDLQNSNLARVIDRRKGIPITLSLLYIHAARAQKWPIDGLNIAGYFICRLEKDSQRILFDPADACKILEAPDLRFLVKHMLGPNAELLSRYYEPLSNKDILIHLQNHIKFRQIDAEDYEGALKTIKDMQLFAPQEYRLLLDAGVLYSKTNHPQEAIRTLEHYIEIAPKNLDHHDAFILLQHLKDSQIP